MAVDTRFFKKRVLGLRVSYFEVRWNMVRFFSEFLLPYRTPGSISHRIVTGLFYSLLKETECASEEFVTILQIRRLQTLLKKTAEIPWWKERFATYGLEVGEIATLTDLEKLTPVSKIDFQDIERKDLMRQFSHGDSRLLWHRTSGTTGLPFEWGVDKNLWTVEITSYFYRALSWYGGYQRFRWLRIAALVYQSYSVPNREIYWNPIGPRAHEDFLVAMKGVRDALCTVLFSYPTNLLLVAKHYAQDSIEAPFKAIVTSGQRLEDEYRSYIEKKMGCMVASLYGAREFGQMAVECPGHRHWYHVNAERLIVEILDDTGHVLPHGEEGLITVTCLDNHVVPLIRYQLGDKGKILDRGCPCGRALPLLEFQGRESGFIKLGSGERVPFRHINSVILNLYFEKFDAYQLEQVGTRSIIFRYTLRAGAAQEFKEDLAKDISHYTSKEMRVTFEEFPEKIPTGKLRVFIPMS